MAVPKDALTPYNVKEDLFKVLGQQRNVKDEMRSAAIVAGSILFLVFGFFFHILPLALLFLAVALYHATRYALELHAHAKRKKQLKLAIEREDFNVSVEKLSYITEETIYEPWVGFRRSHSYKTVTMFGFYSGVKFRLWPHKHYSWSLTYRLSPQGMQNTSLQDDLFYLVTLKGEPDVACIYNQKFFHFPAFDQQNTPKRCEFSPNPPKTENI